MSVTSIPIIFILQNENVYPPVRAETSSESSKYPETSVKRYQLNLNWVKSYTNLLLILVIEKVAYSLMKFRTKQSL